MWIWLILGIILGIALLIPTSYVEPTKEVLVKTVTTTMDVDDLLEEWDLQDHLEELLDEDEEELE
jgi:hypothetical protein